MWYTQTSRAHIQAFCFVFKKVCEPNIRSLNGFGPTWGNTEDVHGDVKKTDFIRKTIRNVQQSQDFSKQNYNFFR